jgi:membrane protein YqaA with SNARE-associated domain
VLAELHRSGGVSGAHGEGALRARVVEGEREYIDAHMTRCVSSPRMEAWTDWLLETLALPKFGLSTVFVVSLVSATLLPLATEPAVFGLVKLNPELFWPAIVVASVGSTIGGAITWWMGYGVEKAYEKATHHSPMENRALTMLRRFGPKACLLAWLPGVGDPLCAVAGWLKLPFWPCVAYMAIGKFLRFVIYTWVLLWVWPNPVGG